jgi:ABC-type transport system substrate-binding protein
MTLYQAIYQLNPTVVTIRNDVAYDVNEQVVQYNLDAAQSLVEANKYKEQRAIAYPSIQDQLDTLYHGGYEVWKATIEEVKQEFPKP